MGKTNPLNDEDLAEFLKLQKTNKDSDKSWTRDIKDLDQETFDLSVKNPDGGEVVVHRKPEQIIKEIQELDKESAEVLAGIKKLL
jgi:type I restriction enzyme M protein